jgi:hypothetical protein
VFSSTRRAQRTMNGSAQGMLCRRFGALTLGRADWK